MLTATEFFFQQWESSELCGVIVGTGAGRAFSAGGDIASSLAVLFPASSSHSPFSGVIEHTANDAAPAPLKAVDFFRLEYGKISLMPNYANCDSDMG